MTRYALLLCAALLTAATFACQVPPPGPPLTPLMPLSYSGPPISFTCDASGFLAKAFMLASGFQADPSRHTQPPSSTTAVIEPYRTDLGNAYCMASQPFRDQLNTLTAVFIDQTCANATSCALTSWGLRERSSGQMYVGLSAGLWSTGVPAYSQYEALILAGLLEITPDKNPVNIAVNSEADLPVTTVLAALAHEMGHVKWWEKKIQTSTCRIRPAPAGSMLRFADNSWEFPTVPTPRWHDFAKSQHPGPNNEPGNTPKDDLPDKDVIKDDLKYNSPYLLSDLGSIYGGEWASMFATVGPDEDFIETYKLWVLTTADSNSLTSLKVTINGTNPVLSPDMVLFFKGTAGTIYNLYKKGQWVQYCVAWP